MDTKDPAADIIDTLSPMERKIVPYLEENFGKIQEKTGLDATSVLRALRFLEAKKILKIEVNEKEHIDLGTNGIYYKKNHLPERRLLIALEEQSPLSLEEAKKKARLSDNELKVSLGVLKQKALINLTNGKLVLQAKKEELMKKTLEEQFIEVLPLQLAALNPEQKYAFEQLKKRKDIIELRKEQEISFSLTELGKEISGKELKTDLIEEVTPDVIKNWNKQKKFRKYNIQAPVPRIYGGKRHFVNQSIEYAKKIWTDLGFKEMEGPMVDSSFWVFDSLFTPQDHPAREMQDTFFLKEIKSTLPDKKIVKAVQEAHEKGVAGSKGWKYTWKEEIAQKPLIRTHTTSLSTRTIAGLKLSELPAKYFAVGKVFRNETVDWKHAFEFNMTEGIVVDENANFRHLLGYLKEFYNKMGYKKIKFVPCFYAYTEPSVEIQYWHAERKEWLELGGAGMFRPEVTAPLFGKPIPVLAWGPGFDRIIMEYYKVKDLRELYANDLKILRNKEFWIK